MEQNENTSLLAQATKCHPGPGAKNGRAPPEAENQNTGGPPPKAPKSPKVNAVDDLTARAAIIEQAVDVSRRWAEAYAALCAMQPPAGFSPERWRQVVDAAGIFLDRWGGDAIRCGWSDLDVFGCHPDRPTARIDCMGLVLLLDRCRVVSVDPDGADLVTASGARQRHYRRPLPPGTVALWELGR